MASLAKVTKNKRGIRDKRINKSRRKKEAKRTLEMRKNEVLV